MTPSPSLPPDGNMFIHYWYSDWAHFPPPCCPTFLQPALLHQSPHETHTHTNVQVCVRDKSCDNLECLLRGVCLCARVCVQASQTETGRLSESPQAARAEFLYLGPYKRLFPASNCAYTSLSNTLFSQVFHLRPSQLCGVVSVCLVCTYMQLHMH